MDMKPLAGPALGCVWLLSCKCCWEFVKFFPLGFLDAACLLCGGLPTQPHSPTCGHREVIWPWGVAFRLRWCWSLALLLARCTRLACISTGSRRSTLACKGAAGGSEFSTLAFHSGVWEQKGSGSLCRRGLATVGFSARTACAPVNILVGWNFLCTAATHSFALAM